MGFKGVVNLKDRSQVSASATTQMVRCHLQDWEEQNLGDKSEEIKKKIQFGYVKGVFRHLSRNIK